MKKIIGIIVLCIVLLAWIITYYYNQNINSGTEWKISSSTNTWWNSAKVYEHTFPEVVVKNDYFQGTFIQNDVVWINPRREAIVKDILVDIWDEVKQWQTLATLFEPWVIGQSDTNIVSQSTRVNSQYKILSETKKVLNAKIAEFDAKISEKQVYLNELIKNYDEKIVLSENSYETKKNSLQLELEKEEKVISTLSTRLRNTKTIEDQDVDTLDIAIENIKSTQEQKKSTIKEELENVIQKHIEELKDLEKDISQEKELFQEKMNELYSQILVLVYIWEERNINYDSISKWDINQFFSIKDSSNLWMLITKIREYQTIRDDIDVDAEYNLISDIISYTLVWLESTISSLWDIGESEISNWISQAQDYKNSLIEQKKLYDDSQADIEILKAQQKKEKAALENSLKQVETDTLALINNVESQIEGRKTNEDVNAEVIQKQIEEQIAKISILESTIALYNDENSVDLVKSEKSLKIESLKSEIRTLKSSKNLLIASENKEITNVWNNLAQAQADLSKITVASNDSKIISSFSWIISKRDIEIGQVISAKDEVFRIAWVENSLSRIAKNEIKFFVPQWLQDLIEPDKEVYFSVSTSWESFTGTVYRISPEIDPETRSITVQAKVWDDIRIANKSSLRVSLETTSLTYKVPTASIYNKEVRKIMYYKKDNGKLWVKDVTIISDDWEYSLVTWDFWTDLKIVTTPIFVK